MERDLIKLFLEENRAWNLTSACLALSGTFLGLRLVQIMVVRRLSRSAPHTDTLFDDIVLDMARRTTSLFQIAVAVATAASLVDLPKHFAHRLHSGLVLIALMQGGIWATGLLQYLLVGLIDRRAEPGDVTHRTGKSMLRFIGLAGIWSLVSLLALENLGVHVSTLMAGLSVTGVALALALQPIIGDLMSSISILLDKPFLVGDYVVCETFSGTIEKIGIRSTRLRALSGEAVILANFDLARARLRNYKSLRERRQTFNFLLRYDTPPEQLEKVPGLIRQIVADVANTRFDRAHFLSFGEVGLQVEVVYYCTVADYLVFCDAQQAINLGLLRRLAEHGIRMAHRHLVDFPIGP